jgi:hypothetical protein
MRGLQRIAAGTKFRPSERTWNAMAAAAERTQVLERGPRAGSLPLVYPGDRIIVRNTSAGNWAPGSVVEVSDFLCGQVENEKLWFDAVEVADLGAVHAILRDGILQNDFGEAQLLGVVRAKVNVNDVNHPACLAKASQTELESAAIGPHRLIHAPGTGSQLCVVILGGGILEEHGSANEDIAQDASGDITIGSFTIEAENYGGVILQTDGRCRVYIRRGRVYCIPLECPAEAPP